MGAEPCHCALCVAWLEAAANADRNIKQRAHYRLEVRRDCVKRSIPKEESHGKAVVRRVLDGMYLETTSSCWSISS